MSSSLLSQKVFSGHTVPNLETSGYIIVVLFSTGHIVPDKFSFNVPVLEITATF